jgi:diguanylate cyclase (GGDEF)-like protein
VVLANEAPDESEEIIASRLQENLKAHNRNEPQFMLSISVGVAPFVPSRTCSVEDLLVQADKAMYAQKRSQRNSSPPGVRNNQEGCLEEGKQEADMRKS